VLRPGQQCGLVTRPVPHGPRGRDAAATEVPGCQWPLGVESVLGNVGAGDGPVDKRAGHPGLMSNALLPVRDERSVPYGEAQHDGINRRAKLRPAVVPVPQRRAERKSPRDPQCGFWLVQHGQSGSQDDDPADQNEGALGLAIVGLEGCAADAAA
jgi:hypothetical protein